MIMRRHRNTCYRNALGFILRRASVIVAGWIRARLTSGNRHFWFRVSLTALLAVSFLAPNGRVVRAADDESCTGALERAATAGFLDSSSAGVLDDRVCTADIQSYVRFIEYMLASRRKPGPEEVRSRLLEVAEAGYLSARIIYTLVFANAFDSRYSKDISAKQSYSRYAPYILSLRLFGEWRQDRIADKFFLASQFAGEAVRRGIIEAFLLKHFFNYVQYRSDNNEAYKRDAAVSLLVLANFLDKTAMARQYLVRVFALDRAELQSFEAVSQNIVARTLADPENSVCEQDRKCALGLNIKRLVCDVRSQNGQILYRIDQRACDQLSETVIYLYRQAVSDAFDSFISGMKP